MQCNIKHTHSYNLNSCIYIYIYMQDTSAGIIPRALSHLFDELRLLESQEFTVRVSFLELYNEELFDLLSPSDDASKIR